MSATDVRFSDYIVYVDESGDHSLKSIDANYPVFVLTFCVFRKEYYADTVAPALRKLKFATFGHDMVILHEHDIRKKKGAFHTLNKEKREAFLEELNVIISRTDVTLIPCVIDKYKLNGQNHKDTHVYHQAMSLCLERLYSFLHENGQTNRMTHVICEARGAGEDRALELEFRHICNGNSTVGKILPFDIVVADKKANSEGLQFADLAARPIGLSIVHPQQSNRALKILEKKFHKTRERGKAERDFIVYP